MNSSRVCFRRTALQWSIVAMLTAPALVMADPASGNAALKRPDPSRLTPSPHLAVPSLEAESGAGQSLANPFASGKAAVPNAQSLSAPVTVNANTSGDAMTVTQTGTGRAISGVINNTKSTISALKGTTNGGGAALAGQNTGTAGPGGQFQVTNTSSTQPGLVSSTTGTGNAIQAIQGSTGSVDTPAVLGQHTGGPNDYGVGVEGDGNYTGVRGTGGSFGVVGTGTTSGIYGYSANGNAVYGNSSNGVAGYFAGTVYATGTVTAQSYATTSDRNVKEAIAPVDTQSVLDRVAAMPIASWDFQTHPGIHHMGPMAQDFHAAFGLGNDDKHIDLIDGLGVSLASIQELQRQAKTKDARIDALEAQLQSLRLAIDGRFAALGTGAVTAAMAQAAQP